MDGRKHICCVLVDTILHYISSSLAFCFTTKSPSACLVYPSVSLCSVAHIGILFALNSQALLLFVFVFVFESLSLITWLVYPCVSLCSGGGSHIGILFGGSSGCARSRRPPWKKCWCVLETRLPAPATTTFRINHTSDGQFVFVFVFLFALLCFCT